MAAGDAARMTVGDNNLTHPIKGAAILSAEKLSQLLLQHPKQDKASA